MPLYKHRYRIDSTRLPHWDYSKDAWYFVTICTRDMALFFGKIVDHDMRLSKAGEIAGEEWQKTESLRSDISLDEWVVTPNHIHGIVVIENEMSGVSARMPSDSRFIETLSDKSRDFVQRDAPAGRLYGSFHWVSLVRHQAEWELWIMYSNGRGLSACLELAEACPERSRRG